MPPDAVAHSEFLVVGAGSAGCVVARRLADAGRQVHMLEAGPLDPTPEVSAMMADGNQPAVRPGLNWRFETTVRGAGGARWLYEAGRVLGGSSAVNATQALRGNPQDHDAWAREVGGETGPEWTWPSVLPTFRAIEDDPLGPSPLHGRGGPLPIRRAAPAELAPLQAGLLRAALEHGFAALDDLNDPAGSGAGMIPRNVVDGRRISVADAYLGPARDVPGLRITGGARAHHLLWNRSGRCLGVRAGHPDGRVFDVLADCVVLCAGAVGTPALLLRSGVGPAGELAALDIPVKIALAGVGKHLVEHPVVGLWGIAREGASRPGEPMRQTLLRCRSASGRSGIDDLHLCIMGGRDPALLQAGAAPGRAAAGLTVCYNTPASRGTVSLASADPCAAPRIALNCLGDDADLAPLREGVQLAWDLMQRPALGGLFEQLFAWNATLVRSPRALDQALRSFVRPAAHLCGSARMGRSPEHGAVVDGGGRLHGCDNLWIADAACIPVAPAAPPHLTVLMTAERISAHLIGVRA